MCEKEQLYFDSTFLVTRRIACHDSCSFSFSAIQIELRSIVLK
jgi:hypothetical protein